MATGEIISYYPDEEGVADGSRRAYLRLKVVETWDTSTNASTLNVTLQAKSRSGFTLSSMTLIGWIGVIPNGGPEQTIASSGSISITNDWADMPAGSCTVPHNADGTATVSFVFHYTDKNTKFFYFYRVYSGTTYSIWLNDQTTWTGELYTIPRASSLTVSNGTLGSPTVITIQKASQDFTHDIEYSCGESQGTVVSGTGASVISFTPPMSLARENTTGTTLTITYTLKTKSGGVVVGTSEASATLTIPESIAPSVQDGWAAVTYYNVGTKAASIAAFVQGYSRAAVEFDESKVDVSGLYGAEIAYYSVVCGGVTITEAPHRTQILNSAGSIQILCTVTDTRGRSDAEVFEVNVLPYANPTLSTIEAFRCNAQGEESPSGTYISVKATANISSLGGLNSAELSVKYKEPGGEYGTAVTLSSGVPAIIGGGLISITSSYVLLITVVDLLTMQAESEATIPTESVAFHIRNGGKGAAFGKYCEQDNRLELPEGWQIKIGSTTLSEAQLQSLLNLL